MIVAKKKPAQCIAHERYSGSRQAAEHRNKNRQGRRKVMLLSALGVIAMTAVLLVAHYAYIVQLNYHLDRSYRELQVLQEEQQHLKLEIASLSSPERLEHIATEEIGLQYPRDNQIIFLALGRAEN